MNAVYVGIGPGAQPGLMLLTGMPRPDRCTSTDSSDHPEPAFRPLVALLTQASDGAASELSSHPQLASLIELHC